MEDWTVVIIVTIVSVLAYFWGKNWVILGTRGRKALEDNLKYWEDYALECEKEIKVLKGKFHQKNQAPQFKGEVTKENLPEIVDQFFPMFADKLPSWAQPFFKVPVLQKMMITWFINNPDKGADMIAKFFTGVGRPPKDKEGQLEEVQVPEGAMVY